MKAYVDNREESMFGVLKKISPYEVTQLPVGDLLVANESGAIIVERKTTADFVNSIKSNRLWEQLLRLMKTEEILGYEVKRRLLAIQGGFWEYTNVSSIVLGKCSWRNYGDNVCL
jgi:ERCC4-type nuclease